ncbi:phosphoglucomutase/phosphomannomutase PgmG [Ferrovibrio xuzhouensis]|uniref:Phosphoglucomutase/phosphomannomutase PgmG n=1 Tax=Ferrovibrio xuzhouensis TaxID=1576914 RepID=A0ABV7VAL4_9PROT
MSRQKFDHSILREYDIRGIVGTTLRPNDAQNLGRAFGTMVRRHGGQTVAVGQDGRLSSPQIANRFARGLRSAGLDVIRIGVGPTPMLYFAERHLKADAGAMITGSHNPPDYNGFKLVLGGKTIYGKAIQELGEIIDSDAMETGQGRSTRRSVLGAYVKRLLQDTDLARPLNVVWDPGNGAACPVVERLVRAIPGRHIVLNGEVDGEFPGHHPDPTLPETLEQLRREVHRQHCDLGIAFDGDGDRIGVIDDSGDILWGDQLMMLWAEDVLRAHPGATVIADVKTSQALFDTVTRYGGKPLMWRTGHSLIKAKMRETGALLAGEMSGHIFFADHYYGFDDALYAALRLLNIIARNSRSLSELHARLPAMINTPELRIDCPESRKFPVIEEIKARLRSNGTALNDIDGIRVSTDEGWWLLRASNTQDILVARCEANDAEGLARLKETVAGQLLASGIQPGPIRTAFGEL